LSVVARSEGWLDRSLFAAFLCLLAWAPLPLASNRSWALGLLASGLLVVLTITVGLAVSRGEPIWPRLRPARWPLLCLTLFAGWVALQTIELPVSILSLVVPGAREPGVVSADVFNTRQYLLATLAYISGFVLSLLLARNEKRLQWLMLALVLSGLVQALIAILLFASRSEYIFLFMPFSQGGRASGTFPNWDHMAGYMEMCLSVGIGLMLARMRGSRDREVSRRQRVVAILDFVMSGKMLLRLTLIVMVIALVMTHSRMGNVAFFASLLLVGGLGMWRNRRMRFAAFWLVLSLIAVDVFVVGQWIGVDRVVQRLQGTAVVNEDARGEETLEQRIEPARQALAMIRERPVAGFGGGGFYTVFPRFKNDNIPWYYDHTHNDYVEIAADTGLVGLGLLGAVILMTWWRVIRLWGEQESRLNRGVAFGVAMALSCLMIHSWVDFNLQIPANALTFCVILSLIWGVVPRQEAKTKRSLVGMPN